MVLYHLSVIVADLCKGSTNDSDSFCPGSNPGSAATKKSYPLWITFFIFIQIHIRPYSLTDSPLLLPQQRLNVLLK